MQLENGRFCIIGYFVVRFVSGKFVGILQSQFLGFIFIFVFFFFLFVLLRHWIELRSILGVQIYFMLLME
jgi:hypothetical protein